MSPDDHADQSGTRSDSKGDLVEWFDGELASRRGFLAGLGLGSIGGAGVALGLTRSDSGFQSLATLAGTATQPANVRYHLPAIDASGSGRIVSVDFEFASGNGELFINLDGIELRHDLQLALHESMETATRITGTSLEDTATQVTFGVTDSRRLALRGKSWEAGLTVAIVAALQRQSPGSDTLITGIVADTGALLPVGNIEEKARAAQAFGANELLVPAAEPVDVSVQNLRVIGVQTIGDALDHTLKS